MPAARLVALAVVLATAADASAADASAADASAADAAANVAWHLAKDYGPALLHGKAAFSTGEQTLNYYSRLPASAEKTTRPSIWGLSQDPAGTFLQFATNSTQVWVNYTLGSSTLSMWHFPSTGVSGIDLYCYDEGNSSWRWVATTRPSYPVTTTQLVSPSMTHSGAGATRRYRMHLPTYNEVRDDLTIGLDAGSPLVPDNSTLVGFQDDEAIVWYGSSILQGGVASRPGQIATHEVSRRLGRLIYNFGFSGNCWMEPEVAAYLAAVTPKPGLIIIDCNPNMVGYPAAGGPPDVFSRTVPLVEYFRANGHPTTPIILSEGTTYGSEWLSITSRQNQANKSAALHSAFVNLTAGTAGHAPDEHLYYATGPGIFSNALNMEPSVGGELADPTVGGTHPTDLGMMKQAVYWEAKIPEVLEAERVKQQQQQLQQQQEEEEEEEEEEDQQRWRSALPTPTPRPVAALRNQWSANDHALARGDLSTIEMALAGVADAEQLQGATSSTADVQWFDATNFLQGRAEFTDPALPRASPFDRLPLDANGTVDDAVWSLSRDSTGMYLRITTNGSAFAINHTLAYASSDLWHMPQTGTDGLDIYTWDAHADNATTGGVSGAWRHYPDAGVETYSAATVVSTIPRAEPVVPDPAGSHQTYLIYLPLRNAPLADFTVGFGAADAAHWCSGAADCKAKGIVDPAPCFRTSPPIVWYGTSIQQGGVASRAGTEYDAIISRTLSREVINMGFAGHGTMQLSVAKYLADVPAPVAAFVIDCLPNMGADAVANRTQPLVQYLRTANGGRHATTPIILAEGTPYPAEWYGGPPFGDASKNANLRAAFDALVAAGDKNLHYVVSADLFGALGPLINPTVGGTHSSDLGQYAIANYYVKALPSILQ